MRRAVKTLAQCPSSYGSLLSDLVPSEHFEVGYSLITPVERFVVAPGENKRNV
jgi:hypothetical protein